MKDETIKIRGMSCQHCQQAVEKALAALSGMAEAKVLLEEGKALVSFDETKLSLKDIWAAIEESGYYVES
ncbi:MAG TPA: copper ion binding protein [Syntrophomonadaceae bacterium]|nr:copper ion binding protein [Syntrophomonadaceae bacterium]